MEDARSKANKNVMRMEDTRRMEELWNLRGMEDARRV